MATFEFTIAHRVLAYLPIAVEAPTVAEAEAKVRAVIDACGGNPDVIAAHYGTDYPGFWEVEEEDITVERDEQLDRV